MPFFEYGETELSALRRQAPELSVFIDRFGMIKRETTPDLFTALAQAVISQQISTKAMRTVWSRVINRFGEPSPRLFLTERIDQREPSAAFGRRNLRSAANARRNRQMDG